VATDGAPAVHVAPDPFVLILHQGRMDCATWDVQVSHRKASFLLKAPATLSGDPVQATFRFLHSLSHDKHSWILRLSLQG
jgi:hypothetical protein